MERLHRCCECGRYSKAEKHDQTGVDWETPFYCSNKDEFVFPYNWAICTEFIPIDINITPEE